MKLQIDPYTMTSGDVARVFGFTDEWVRQHDDEFKPKRRASGRRYYRREDVERVARQRAAVRGAK